MCFPYQSLYTTVFQSSAKLLQGTAALTFIVFGQVPTVTSNWHWPLTLANVLYSTQSHQQMFALMINGFHGLPAPVCLICSREIRLSMKLTKTLLFPFKLPNPALDWKCQNTPTMDPDRWPRACFCLYSAWTSPPPGPLSNQFLYFNFSCGLFLNLSSLSSNPTTSTPWSIY